ncbi:hypothetical protein D3C77_551210 [compost metagenome]
MITRAGKHDEQIGVNCSADPIFTACQPPSFVCTLGLRAHRLENVGATAFFRQAERSLNFAGTKPRQILVLLLRGAVLAKQAGGHKLDDAKNRHRCGHAAEGF